ncbi:glycoside hydrolase family 18 protein [Lipingzhangella sp. LS1_29]|uniref:chitinase n=1 Tax=Lipingzhangella rawalii TaxID=2055835 RepID=A0ABU2H7E1_9ACTN|nr:glycoside hydrolase family 18 protein [Lipingzhangella rawalii]MDS1271223.1 glycoside hydrolase family 18 protein [Lipingzhangella rawalii]
MTRTGTSGGSATLAQRNRVLLGVAVAAVLGALFFSVLTVITTNGSRGGGEGADRERVAYFADWNTANRGYRILDVAESGAAEHMSTLLWAFGDVNAEGLCYIDPDANQPWEIYQRRYDAADSVDGEGDEHDQQLAGSLNQLDKLKDDHAHLRAGISLGGWNWSTYFSNAAATEESRAEFARSCIDLWLRGNLPQLNDEPQGGEGAAEGVFDGIDIDWEWPGGGGHADNVTRPDDGANFTLMVRELRRQLDDYAEESGRDLFLSASFPHSEELMRAGVEPEVFDYLDFATVQGYDFTGTWSDVTDHHSQLYAPEGAPSSASAHAAVQRYLDHGLPAEKLVLGIPAFGRGWTGVDRANFGRFQPGEPAEGSYGAGVDPYNELQERPGQRFLDPVNGAYWIYDGTEWWTYDTPWIVNMKGEYAREHDLGGLMLWNLDQDPDAELVEAMDTGLAE